MVCTWNFRAPLADNGRGGFGDAGSKPGSALPFLFPFVRSSARIESKFSLALVSSSQVIDYGETPDVESFGVARTVDYCPVAQLPHK
jgi:hypothetical protein